MPRFGMKRGLFMISAIIKSGNHNELFIFTDFAAATLSHHIISYCYDKKYIYNQWAKKPQR